MFHCRRSIASKVDYFYNYQLKLQQRENRGNRVKRDRNMFSSSPARLAEELLCDVSLRGSVPAIGIIRFGVRSVDY